MRSSLDIVNLLVHSFTGTVLANRFGTMRDWALKTVLDSRSSIPRLADVGLLMMAGVCCYRCMATITAAFDLPPAPLYPPTFDDCPFSAETSHRGVTQFAPVCF